MPILDVLGPEIRLPGSKPAAPRSRVPHDLPKPSVEWGPALERETAHLYEKVKAVIPPVEWPFMAPYIKEINDLKMKRNAVILAHNYQTPEIFHCVADIVGDSLQLAREAAKVKQDIIVQCGVHFMAETSKILSPNKTVLIPDSRAGCSLAASITGDDVRLLRERFPGVPIVAYVNTSADVKAEVDICCTSSNAAEVVESLGVRHGDLPARPVSRERYVAAQNQGQDHRLEGRLRGARALHRRGAARATALSEPSLQIIAHPECPPDVLAEADYHRLDRRHDPALGAR